MTCPHCTEMRERIEQLEMALLDGKREAPTWFRLSNSGRHRSTKVWRVIAAIAARQSVTRDALFSTLYAHLPCDKQPGGNVLDVWITHARSALRPFGIYFETIHGEGWRMTDENRRKFKALVEQRAEAA